VTFSIIDALPAIDLAILHPGKMGVQHLGEHGSDGLDIDPDTLGERAIHALQLRSPSEQFAIDVADALEETL
jgi:hypothetical protein